jgi:hypothetical protein
MAIDLYRVSLPLIRGVRHSPQGIVAKDFLGSATVVGKTVCTCKHVVASVDFSREVVLTKWSLQGPWVVFTGARRHPQFDFAVLDSAEQPPLDSLPLFQNMMTMGTMVCAAGYHYDGVAQTPSGESLMLAPRAFLGNVVRVHDSVSNHSPAVCELSFPTLSGFSGAPLVSRDFDRIVGMVYGNVEQSILVHSRYEQRDGNTEFSETVNRILDLGLFHLPTHIQRFLQDLNAA